MASPDAAPDHTRRWDGQASGRTHQSSNYVTGCSHDTSSNGTSTFTLP